MADWEGFYCSVYRDAGRERPRNSETDEGLETPAEQNIGERIFVDTRFAEYFAANMTDVNPPLAVGDPVVATVQTPNGLLPGPVCRAIH